MAVRAAQTRPSRGTAPGYLAGTFCGPIESVPPVRGPAAGRANKQMVPSLSRLTCNTKVFHDLPAKDADNLTVAEHGRALYRDDQDDADSGAVQ